MKASISLASKAADCLLCRLSDANIVHGADKDDAEQSTVLSAWTSRRVLQDACRLLIIMRAWRCKTSSGEESYPILYVGYYLPSRRIPFVRGMANISWNCYIFPVRIDLKTGNLLVVISSLIITMSLRWSYFSSPKTLQWLLWMFPLCADFTASLAIQSENGLTMQLNLTNWNNPLDRPTGEYRCQRSKDWVTEGFDGEDCFRAIEHFHDVEVLEHKKSKFEFIAPTKPPAHPSLKPQATPRNYTYGKGSRSDSSIATRGLYCLTDLTKQALA